MASSVTGTHPIPVPNRTLPVDEEPPPYTPSPDVYHGEATLEGGPRGGQRPPVRPIANLPTSSHSQSFSLPRQSGGLRSLWNQLQDAANQANEHFNRPSPPARPGYAWPAQPGQSYSVGPSPPPPQPPSRPHHTGNNAAPPPQHPAAQRLQSPETHRPEDRRASSEFARDFYAAGGEVPPDLVPPSASSSSRPAIPDAPGKPTTTPTPGHPLLKDGQLLVYPKGYECDKCHNTGYKLSSMKPCKRCWPKYGKPFSGPLAYSFNDPATNSASNFQRPLPTTFVPSSSSSGPPGAAAASSRPPVLPPRPHNTISSAAWHTPLVSSSYRDYRPQPVIVPGGGGYPHTMPMSGMRPGNSVVYVAGDPRIGGKRCWRCDGSGTISLLIIDREQCPICGGLGRTFR